MAQQFVPNSGMMGPPIEMEDDYETDPDEPSSNQTSLASAMVNSRYENGRRYHVLEDEGYFLPNDKKEQNRMELLHTIYNRILHGRPHCAPLKPDIKHVLDLGTGAGTWAIEFADQYPNAQVIGIDITPIQRRFTPPNCTFEIHDMEADWPYGTTTTTSTTCTPSSTITTVTTCTPATFDFIRTREIPGAVHDYQKLFTQAYNHLKPGGYLEMQSMEANYFSDDGTHERAVSAVQWRRLLVEASRMVGKELGVEVGWKEAMERAGFRGVKEIVYKVPFSPWPKGPHWEELGRYQAAHIQEMVQAYSLALFTRVLGWSTKELDILLTAVGNDFRDPQSHLYAKIRVVYGQKEEVV
ncbi:hypothetical protein AJ79_03472 [Helicocarpus griseus UAMH5409]|uniref:Methyltransferase domain-containing protein n=1 Tax=Helicocarpus griseus UAMH5409 TaxID=1447875 RepID=A0A2B7XYB6_9EURO|nr:hypothetical protein AJ79_03472 [Helicocarpus griseus UAMH5409]